DQLVYDVGGLGPLEPLLDDPSITEIMVNGADRVFIEREGRVVPVVCEIDAPTIVRLVERVVAPLGLRLGRASPMVAAPPAAQPHVVRLEARPANAEGTGAISVRDLVRSALRMRPDRIVVGEVRGGEALDMLQACNTGHDGSLSTVHANSPDDALARIETLVLCADLPLPLSAARPQTASPIDAAVPVR